MPARFVAYLAVTVDGFIAEEDGGVAFLDAYNPSDFGFEEFLSGIDALVMGRATFDQAVGFGAWPYGERPAHVVTSTPLTPGSPASAQAWCDGVVGLVEKLRREGAGNVWIVGGTKLLDAFLREGAVDEFDLFVIPTLLGRGLPLFLGGPPHALQLITSRTFPAGVVRLRYEVKNE